MKKIFLLILIISLIFSVIAFAGNNGGNNPLSLDISMPADGAADIPVDQEIKLTFSNNVINSSIKENNMSCFQLVDSTGKEVAIEVIMGDDQINPDQKNDIIVKPIENLSEGITYSLKINGDLSSKNGNTLSEEIIVSFSTVSSGMNKNIILIAGIFVVAIIALFIRRKKTK